MGGVPGGPGEGQGQGQEDQGTLKQLWESTYLFYFYLVLLAYVERFRASR